METRSLWLVRHGQASFGKSDYDNLSETGHEQAYLLGKHFAAMGVTPSVLVSGSMKRHRQTLAEIAAGASWQLVDAAPQDDAPQDDAGRAASTKPATTTIAAFDADAPAGSTPHAPEAAGTPSDTPEKAEKAEKAEKSPKNKPDKHRKPAHAVIDDVASAHAPLLVPRRVDERWNELDARALLTAYKPAYRNMLVLKADMVRTLRPKIAFEDTFEKAVDRWSSGEFDHDYPESFEHFISRTDAALDDLAAGDEQHAIVVTSAGPVCWTAARLAAGGSLDAWKHFTLAATNTGVTRITIDRHGPRLLTFNEFGHLEAAGLVTNR